MAIRLRGSDHPAREAAARARHVARLTRYLAQGRLSRTDRNLAHVADLADAAALWADGAEQVEADQVD